MRSLLILIVVAACSTTPAQQAALTGSAVTLATVAAANNTTVADVVRKGQLFCSGAEGVFAVQGTSVIGKAGPVVLAACQAVDAIAVPVSPPTAAGAVPVRS